MFVLMVWTRYMCYKSASAPTVGCVVGGGDGSAPNQTVLSPTTFAFFESFHHIPYNFYQNNTNVFALTVWIRSKEKSSLSLRRKGGAVGRGGVGGFHPIVLSPNYSLFCNNSRKSTAISTSIGGYNKKIISYLM